ncbi:UNVERIFIED_CONTAM: hypothetical protein K2H54_036322 [Gekko kuhli]
MLAMQDCPAFDKGKWINLRITCRVTLLICGFRGSIKLMPCNVEDKGGHSSDTTQQVILDERQSSHLGLQNILRWLRLCEKRSHYQRTHQCLSSHRPFWEASVIIIEPFALLTLPSSFVKV